MTVMTNGGDNCEQKQQVSCVDVPFYMTCDGQKKKDSSNSNSGSSSSTTKTIVIDPSSTANAADVSNCKLDGSANGIQQKFDIAKYQACGLYPNSQKAYTDGFVMGCTQIGNTQLICQALVDSSILNTKTQPTQTQEQPTQAIQPATVTLS